MAKRQDIVFRGGSFDDGDLVNTWRWEWCDKTVNGRRLGEFIRKLEMKGQSWCSLCEKEVSYSSRGYSALSAHVDRGIHKEKLKLWQENQTLPGNPQITESTYGIHPDLLKELALVPTVQEKRVPLDDRVKNLEAMTIAYIAENNLPLSMSNSLIGYAREMCRDQEALKRVKLDRSTASYKMRYGVGEAIREELVKELQAIMFSLNIDEAMDAHNQKIVTILCSHFSEKEQEVVINHLSSFELIKVTSQTLFQGLDRVFTSLDLPRNNLLSIMMDSCNVMRGSKNGLEKRLRDERAPHLLDIDGDTCHHAHNAAKAFCKPFNNHLENLLRDLALDFKWSPESKEFFFQLCKLLGTAPSAPQQYVPHRWLSVLHVSMDLLRLLDVVTVYYSCYLQPNTFRLYEDIVKSAQRNVSNDGRSLLKETKSAIAAKTKSATMEGKDRKARITELLFTQRSQTLLILNFYVSVLPDLDRYVKVFQSNEPKLHELHHKQEVILKQFLAKFIQPEYLDKSAKKLKQLKVEDESLHLPSSLVFHGVNTDKLLKERPKSDSIRTNFEKKALQAFIKGSQVLLEKMPLNNNCLKAFSSLDPELRGTTASLNFMNKLTQIIPGVADEAALLQEIRLFQVDGQLAAPTGRVDEWWAKVDTKKYANLTKLVKAALSCFHGPLVESTFSVMGNIVTKNKTNMNVQTFASYQTIKYHLKSINKTSLEYFSKDDTLKDAVCGRLTEKMRRACSRNEERKQEQQRQSSVQRKAGGMEKTGTKKAELAQLSKSLISSTCTEGKNSTSTENISPPSNLTTTKASNKRPASLHNKSENGQCKRARIDTCASGSPDDPKKLNKAKKQSLIGGFFKPVSK